jgi:bifunctional DNase/RNase
MVQVRILGVARDSLGQHIVLLKPVGMEAGEGIVLPIWIGAQEATSVFIAVEGAQAPRPLSHDLMKAMLDAVGAEVERVDVTRIEDGTFFAELSLRTHLGRRILDARPSDAVALASRVAAPIWVADEVLAVAGIADDFPDDDDVQIGVDEGETPTEETKLAEFKAFLDEVEPEDFEH